MEAYTWQVERDNVISNDHTRKINHFMILSFLKCRSSQNGRQTFMTFTTLYDLADVDLPCLVYNHTLAGEAEQCHIQRPLYDSWLLKFS